MSHRTQNHREKIMRRLYFRLIALSVISLTVLLASCSSDSDQLAVDTQSSENSPVSSQGLHQQDHSTADTRGPSIEFTAASGEVWPPQPREISNVVQLDVQTAKRADSDQLKRTRKTLSDNPELSGKRLAVISSYKTTDKSGGLPRIATEIFVYDTNQVLTVSVSTDGSEPYDYTWSEAHNYQPPESLEEVNQATALASDALLQQGFTEHLKLTGAALLAHPDADTAGSGRAYYSDRKLYVTFGPGNGELPHYSALVNLSRSTVEHSGAVR